MIRDLGLLNLLNQIIGRNRNVIIREFNGQELRLDPPPNVGDLVHKEGYLYSIKLSSSSRLILRHLQGRWFRTVAYFSDHLLYSHFLDVYFNNCCTF
jgi:hypothetical protein